MSSTVTVTVVSVLKEFRVVTGVKGTRDYDEKTKGTVGGHSSETKRN